MKENVRKQLAEGLLKDLSKAENIRTRKQVQAARPQLLFLENLDFINLTIKELVKRGRLAKSFRITELTDGDLQEARKIASTYQNDFIKKNKNFKEGGNNIENTAGGMFLKNKFPEHYKKVLANEAFMFHSFKEISDCKKQIIEKLVKTTKNNLKRITRRIDRGHGGGDGIAVSGVQIAKGIGRVDKALEGDEEAKEAFSNEFNSFMEEALTDGTITPEIADDLIRVQLQYTQVVDASGKLSASYIPFIEFQNKYENSGTQKAREVAAKKLVKTFFEKVGAGELTSLQGSSSIKEKMIAKALTPLVGIKIKNKKVKIDARIDPRKVKLKTKGKVSQRSTGKKVGGALAISTGKMAKSQPVAKVQKSTSSNFSVAAIMGNMNAKLPGKVAENMGSPALEQRTGRFAASARVTDVIKTPHGYPSVGYTYMQEPYSVFETTSGSRFADANRDPRVIIDRSIREIAAEMAIGRLYTRRS